MRTTYLVLASNPEYSILWNNIVFNGTHSVPYGPGKYSWNHNMKVLDELGIFWPTDTGHNEVSGIYCYGHWPNYFSDHVFPLLSACWQQVDAEICSETIRTDEGFFFIMPIWIRHWPNDNRWRATIELTAHEALELGASVVWFGGAGTSWSLSELAPHTSSGLVYAAASQTTGLIFHAELSEEIQYLTDDELVSLIS